METPKYLPGEKVGHLEIIGDTGRRNSTGEIIYRCRCQCGKEFEMRSSAINETKNCGCKSNILRGFVEGTYLPHIKPDKPIRKNNTSGCTGVVKYNDSWEAQIKIKQHKIHLGVFATYEEAVAARKAAEEKYFKPIYERYNDIMT